MKKIIASSALLALALGVGQVYAADGSITGEANVDGGSFTVPDSTDGSAFVSKGFTYTLSSNVAANGLQDAVNFAVVAAHTKGMYNFGGSTKGGSVSACEDDPSDAAVTLKTPSAADDACGTTGGGSGSGS